MPEARIRFVASLIAALLAVSACTPGGDSDATTAELFAADFEPVSIAASSCDYGGLLRRISADNRLTVRFELCRPDVTFGSKMASPAFGVLPSQVLDAAAGDGIEVLAEPVGTGPYTFAAWEPGEEIRFERFDGYRVEPAESAELIFRWDPDPAARLAALEAGDSDGIDAPPPESHEAIASAESLDLYPRTGTNVVYLGINTDHDGLSDRAVRQALVTAIDRERLVEESFPPVSSAAEQTLPSSLAGWTPTPVWPAADAAAAREVLAPAALTGLAIAFASEGSAPLPDPAAVAGALQAQLAEAGVEVELQPMAQEAFDAALAEGSLPLFLDVWEPTTPDVADFFDEMFMGDASVRFGSDLEEIRETIVGARLGDADQRYVANEFVVQAIIDAAPLVPLGHVNGAAAYRADVEDTRVVRFGLDDFQPTASPLGAEYFYAMDPGGRDTFVWTQASEPRGLFCAVETDIDTLRACAQVTEPLLRFETGGGEVADGITEIWSANDDASIWTFRLLDGIEFHDGSHLDAGDVVRTLALQWDSTDPLHTGEFPVFLSMFGAYLGPGDREDG